MYNGKEHIFSSLGVATNVILRASSNEQFQIQGTLNVVDSPSENASILLNGVGIGEYTTLTQLSDVTITDVLDNNVLQYDSGTSKWINSEGKLTYIPNTEEPQGPNLTVAKNYIGVGTQYLSFVGDTIKFGTDTNFSSGSIQYVSPTTLLVSPTYFRLDRNYLLPTTSSLYVGNTSSGEWGRITWPLSSTLSLGGNSYINQNLATTSIPTFKGLTVGQVNNPCTMTISSGDYTVYNQPNYLLFKCGYGDAPYDQWTFIKGTNAQSNGNGSSQQELSIGKTSNGVDIVYQKIDYQGRITTPYQTRFQCYPSVDINITNDVDFDIKLNTTVFNVGSGYNTTTGVFTVPISGIYQFSGFLSIQDVDDDYVYLKLVTTSQQYVLFQQGVNYPDNYLCINFNQICQLTAGNTVKLVIYRYSQSGISSPYIYQSLINSNFSGMLIG